VASLSVVAQMHDEIHREIDVGGIGKQDSQAATQFDDQPRRGRRG
jgi:hypothetical protein